MSGQKIEIRRAQEQDIPLILEFIQELAAYERLRDTCVASEERLRTTLFGDRPDAEVIFAVIDNKEVGFALFFHNYSTFLAQRGLYLEDLFVYPEARGKGAGHALLSALARISMERDCGRLEWNVLNWNQLAIDFYKRIGAVPLDQWTTFRVTGDALEALASHSIIGMTEPHPATTPQQQEGIVARLLHGRSLTPLIGPWLGCLIATVLVFFLEYELPAFHEVVQIFYFVIAVVFIVATARYFRPRERDRRLSGRRMKDRLKTRQPTA